MEDGMFELDPEAVKKAQLHNMARLLELITGLETHGDVELTHREAKAILKRLLDAGMEMPK